MTASTDLINYDPADVTPNLTLPWLMPSQAQKHVTHNEALAGLDAIVHLSVLDRDLTTPPSLPAEGDRYILPSAATGVWAGRADQIAAWQDGVWAFHTPRAGWRAFVTDEHTMVFFDGALWRLETDVIAELRNISRVGLGTTADAANPFAAKLNTALWTARTIAEGGDGSLRSVLNKETPPATSSLLFQTGYTGRAEIGTMGDDKWRLKVSADGSSWATAMTVDPANAFVGLGTDAPTNRLQLEGSTTLAAAIKLRSVGATGPELGGGLLLHYNDATNGRPTAGDRLGYVLFGTTDGATNRQGGGIEARADGPYSATSLPTSFTFATAPSGSSSRIERLRIDSRGHVKVSNGSFGRTPPARKTADFTVSDTETWLVVDKPGSASTITLPVAADWPGRELTIKSQQAQPVLSASANVVPVAGGTPSSSILPAAAGKWACLVSDGTNWVTMMAN